MARPNSVGLKRDRSVWPVPNVDSTKANLLGIELRVDNYHDGWLHYQGSKEALRACGAVPAGFALPGEEGSGRKGSRTAFLTDGRRIKAGRSNEFYWIVIMPSARDEKRLRDESYERHKAQQAEHVELERLAKRIDAWPKSAASFRASMQNYVTSTLSSLVDMMSGGLYEGCGVDEESMCEIRDAVGYLLGAIEDARFYVSEKKLNEYKAQLRKQDSSFQEFVGQLTAITSRD